jgi:ubiquitin C-terminal hydrolase
MEWSQQSKLTCTRCKQDRAAEHETKELVLHVAVPHCNADSKREKSKTFKMQDLIDHYFNVPEFLDEDTYCPGCQSTTPTLKTFSMVDPPEFLVIQALLFKCKNGEAHKLSVVVQPDDISIILAGPPDTPPVIYRAYAVVSHEGTSPVSGHYIATACGSGCTARSPQCGYSQGRCWWLFNDRKVSGPMSKSDALDMVLKQVSNLYSSRIIMQLMKFCLQAKPYMFFYVRCTADGSSASSPTCSLCDRGQQWRNFLKTSLM